MYVLLGIAAGMMVVIGFYFYHFLCRMLTFWYKKEIKRWMKIALIVCAVTLCAASVNPFGTPALVVYHILGIAIALDIINALVRLIAKHKNKQFSVWNKVVACGLIPLLITAMVISYGYVHMLDVHEKTYMVTSQKPLNNSKGYKVAFISDLHFENTMREEKLQKYCNEISAQNPDLVILGGDIVDEQTSKKGMERCLQILGKTKAKYGVFYVYGNHDSASYSSSPNFTLEDLNHSLEESNIQCISDKTCKLGDDLLLVGRNDKGYGGTSSRKSVTQLLQGQDKNKFVLLVDHQPVELKENAASGVDLQLSGHTHGGQIWPVGLITDILGFGEINYGERKIGNYTILVSSGIAGWGYPVRTGHNSEYLMIDIK